MIYRDYSRYKGPVALNSRAAYISAVFDELTIADWKVIVRAMIAEAKKGNYKATRWLTDFVAGDVRVMVAPEMFTQEPQDGLVLYQAVDEAEYLRLLGGG
jgi:hypothetical protein